MRLAERATTPEQTGAAGGRRGALRDRLGGRGGRGLLIALAYTLATVVMTWPLAARIGTHTPLGEDPLLQIWIARWVQHALVTDPLGLYNANAFFPYENSLAYSDSNVPAALLAAPAFLLTGNAILAVNLLVLGTFVLAAGGMCALIARLSGNRAAGFLAGLAYAFLPYRYVHIWHLSQLGHAWTPWVLLALVALVARRTRRAAALFGLLLAVQTLTSFYVAFQLAFAVGIALLVALAADRRARGPRFAGLFAAACLLAGAIVLPFALPYLEVRDQLGLERTLTETEQPGWFATPRSYLRVARGNDLWGRFGGGSFAEDTLFPGGLALLGAIVGLAGWRRRPAATAAALAIAATAFAISLGPTWHGAAGAGLPLPYRFLFDHFPFFKAMRVPARFGVLTAFAIVALAGLGVAWAWERLARRAGVEADAPRPAPPRALGPALTAGLAGLLLLELASTPIALQWIDRRPEVAAPYEWLARQPGQGAVMEFPVSLEGPDLARAMYWSTVHWKPLVQGYSGFAPPAYGNSLGYFTGDLRRQDGTVAKDISHVNERNIGLLQEIGVRYLVLHRRGYKREDWPAVLARLEATGAVERGGDFGEATVYRVREPVAPPPALDVALFAPSLALPDRFWEPAVVVRNPSERLATLGGTRPPRLTTIWRDAGGREVRRDTLPLNLPAFIPPGELLCSARVCPAASGFSLAAAPDGGGPRLSPDAPGRYTVEIALTGEIALRRTLEVDVAAATPAAEPDGPPLALSGATAHAETLAPGEALALTLDWTVRRAPPEDYTLFSQLIGPDGRVWGQYDAPAGWTSHYTAAWLPGERVSLPWTVPLKPDAPPGRYRLLVGMYRRTPAGVERVPLRYPDGDAPEYWAGEITVE